MEFFSDGTVARDSTQGLKIEKSLPGI
uniref:Uncharacterized protein n=1 Tax=Anguilla anguilla TaxID=7936 RepID=A0A0E9PS43_ANGAN